jgi:hypothetical protein
MNKTAIIAVSLIIIPASIAMAAEAFHLKCDNTNCNFEGGIRIGGGFSHNRISGYCTTCRQYVSLVWANNSKIPVYNLIDKNKTLPQKAPDSIGSIWHPAIGRTATLYSCPTCKNPFMGIELMDFRTVPENARQVLLSHLRKIVSEKIQEGSKELALIKNAELKPLTDEQKEMLELVTREKEDATHMAVDVLIQKVSDLVNDVPVICPHCTNQTFTVTYWGSFD